MSSVQADIDIEVKGIELTICITADVDSDKCIENKEYFWTNPETKKQEDLSPRLTNYIEKHHEQEIDEALYLAEVSDFDFEYDQWKERNL
tara:strand:- start:5928 stop:6197 length:270 start_codon:yes stop_codon:yes gene_type:complete